MDIGHPCLGPGLSKKKSQEENNSWASGPFIPSWLEQTAAI